MKRPDNIKRWIGLAVSVLGAGMLLLAIGAGFFGIDRDIGWGPARRFLLATGIALALLPHTAVLLERAQYVIYALVKVVGLDRFRGSTSIVSKDPERDDDRLSIRQEQRYKLVRTGGINLTIVSIFLLALITYSWLISVGRWNEWLGTTDYYHLLAGGFHSGQTHLAIDPPEDLLALPDPYDVDARKGLSYLWDVSLFDGKYYLYWGPTPGFIVLILETVLPLTLGDNVLVWMFASGCVGFLLLILRLLWVEVFSDLPWWTFIPMASLAAFTNPLPWLMTRPAVYEAAILSGQLFFVGGTYWMLTAIIRDDASAWRYLLAGLFWSLAVGSRVTLAPAVIMLTLGALGLMIRKHQQLDSQGPTVWRELSLLLLPLLIGAGLLAFYNFDRFGSIFELGHRFQLGRTNKNDLYSGVISLRNVPQNLFNYLINPFRTLVVFPYVKPTWGKYSIPFLRYTAAPNYHTEQVIGVLLASPITLLAVFPVVSWLRWRWKRIGQDSGFQRSSRGIEAGSRMRDIYLWVSLGVVFIVGPLLLLRVNSMRHELDFIPLLVILTSIGSGYLLLTSTRSSSTQHFKFLVICLLVLFSSAMAMLLAITGYNSTFEVHNRQLFDLLVRFFSF